MTPPTPRTASTVQPMNTLTEIIKKTMRRLIEDNRALGGDSWREYSDEEIIEVYGYLPSWAVRTKNPKDTTQ